MSKLSDARRKAQELADAGKKKADELRKHEPVDRVFTTTADVGRKAKAGTEKVVTTGVDRAQRKVGASEYLEELDKALSELAIVAAAQEARIRALELRSSE